MSIAVAMNARGAMGLVLATVGLSLGILNQQMFSIIVVVAVVTSFMAPLGLRLTMRKVRMTEEEARRIEAAEAKGAFDPEHVRILVPTAGGNNALGAAALAFGLAKKSSNVVEVLHVVATSTLGDKIRRLWVRDPARISLDQHLEALKGLAAGGSSPNVRRFTSDDVSKTVVEEANKGYDIIVVGATERRSHVIEGVVESAPCHVAIVRTVGHGDDFRRLIVLIDGMLVSRVAAEFAVRFAELTGADLTLALISEQRTQATSHPGDSIPVALPAPSVRDPESELERISRVFKSTDLRPTIVRLGYDPTHSALADELGTGKYDLVVLGAENRAIQHRLFFGYEKERLFRKSPVSVAVVVPNVARLA
jgi:nucleotide-binding universal stress UspA family protein